jgi:hypothetical protein
VGEWHLLTQDGFYLTRLFEGDPLKMKYPDAAVPGAVMDAAPPGSGGEDFGGSLTQGKDGKVYVQTGKTAFWNLEVVGLENVKALAGGKVTITPDDAKQAAAIREQLLQARVGAGTVTARKMTPPMTGNLAADFKGAESISYQKTDEAAVKSAVAWDDQNLYLAWEVKDPTPWVNGADAPEFLYARGDTVDFQLATDPSADPKRREAVRGDLRLSIGPFKGKPAAVLYRKVADEKHPKTFSSGVVKAYLMESVQGVEDAKVVVKTRPGGYTVEAAVPLKALGLVPKAGLKLSGDFGVTHGDPAGGDTLLRTYWNNQKTGIVNDEVFELQMEPTNWGQIIFQE